MRGREVREVSVVWHSIEPVGRDVGTAAHYEVHCWCALLLVPVAAEIIPVNEATSSSSSMHVRRLRDSAREGRRELAKDRDTRAPSDC